MNLEKEYSCVVSGSFDKAKPEIDKTIDIFTEMGINVLAPDKGWLYLPPEKRKFGFRPLESEVGMAIRDIEDDFLQKLKRADFHYLVILNGYLGLSSAFELGYSKSLNIPAFASEQIQNLLNHDLSSQQNQPVRVCMPQEVIFQLEKVNNL